MSAILIITMMIAFIATIYLAHKDGKQIGREYGYNEARARMRHPSNQSNVRVRPREHQ